MVGPVVSAARCAWNSAGIAAICAMLGDGVAARCACILVGDLAVDSEATDRDVVVSAERCT